MLPAYLTQTKIPPTAFCFLHFIRNNDFPNVVVIFGFALFFWRTGNLFFLALLVSIDHSHTILQHKPSQKFNMCAFVESSQAFVAKAVIACVHRCPYIVRRRALLCVLLTHVWKPGFTCCSYVIQGPTYQAIMIIATDYTLQHDSSMPNQTNDCVYIYTVNNYTQCYMSYYQSIKQLGMVRNQLHFTQI